MGRKLELGQAAMNDVMNNYKSRAKRKKLVFNLSKEDFKFLTSQNCNYCGCSPKHSVNRPHSNPKYKNSLRFNGDYLYNGIDRKDSKLGYVLDNCVTCCRDCNTIKHDILSYDEMLVVMKTLIDYRKTKNG